MLRLARLDAPGVLHHIIIRGIERRKIFRDNKDRDNFIDRLSDLLPATQTTCYAWAFIPNHAHFLFRSSGKISTLMRRLLTGYAIYFNRRHRKIYSKDARFKLRSGTCYAIGQFGSWE